MCTYSLFLGFKIFSLKTQAGRLFNWQLQFRNMQCTFQLSFALLFRFQLFALAFARVLRTTITRHIWYLLTICVSIVSIFTLQHLIKIYNS